MNEEFEIPDSLDLDELPVTLLTGKQLVDRYDIVLNSLLEQGQALNPTTQTGRDLHSERTALLIELQRRGLR